MERYIPQSSSLGAWAGNLQTAVQTIAGRYVGANPPIGYTFRPFHIGGFMQDAEGFYLLDLAEKFPSLPDGERACAVGAVWSDGGMETEGLVCGAVPCRVLLNGREIFCGSGDAAFPLAFEPGWNDLCVELMRRGPNLVCRFKIANLMNVLSPRRDGQLGFACHTGAFGTAKPDAFLPKPEQCGDLETLFPAVPAGGVCWLISRLVQEEPETAVCLRIETDSPVSIRLDDTVVYEAAAGGTARFAAAAGGHVLTVRSVRGSGPWNCRVSCSTHALRLPFPVRGIPAPWLYAGPFGPESMYTAQELSEPRHVFSDALGGASYFRPALRDTVLRVCYENAFFSARWVSGGVTAFGRWDYPLGVTLYGLHRAGEFLNSRELTEYVRSHIAACCGFADYARYDHARYGFCSIDFRLTAMSMLDHCGSFGSCMLEAAGTEYLPIADRIAAFMLHQVERKPDGSFYRQCTGEYLENTLWADDLYMSVPFLKRYYRLTGNEEALDLACLQFLRFRDYLMMPETSLLSHVYDFKRGAPCGVPWGRGNGWCLFSLAELLPDIPARHPCRRELLILFQTHSAGILAQQGPSGMWHQVLNDRQSFPETSCTAMFLYGFSRGLRYGWLPEKEGYRRAVRRARAALLTRCVDRQGNVYGVCQGSMYSFDADYYKHELKPVINDNHGVGIVLLALIESGALLDDMDLTAEPEPEFSEIRQ